MAATMKDIARKTGLSLATISKFLNGGHVLDENRKAIESAVTDLGYTVNTLARSLKTSRSMAIGVLIPDLENVFSTTIVSNLENRLQQAGYSTLICDYQQDVRLEREKFNFLEQRQIDGLVMMPLSGYSEGIRRLQARQIPVVLIDRPVRRVSCDTVLVKNRAAGQYAVTQLLRSGHRRIGIICGPRGIYTSDERLQGYLQAYAARGLVHDPSLVLHGDYRTASGYQLANKLLDLDNPPTALFVTNHEMTFGAVLAINEQRLIWPDDLSFIGFDHQLLGQVMRPPLSLVTQPLRAIGQVVGDLLLQRLSGELTGQPVIRQLDSIWLAGASYGPPRC